MSSATDQMALWAADHTARTVTSDVADPVARVLLDRCEPHLDHLFDYLVPASLDEAAQPGRRCRVRFAGRLTDAWIVERASTTTHTGALHPLSSVTHRLRVLTEPIAELATELARRYCGVTADVLNQAIPPRHARTEKALLEGPPQPPLPSHDVSVTAWKRWEQGPMFLAHLADGTAPRAVVEALPGEGALGWEALFGEAARATLASGRGVILLVPTAPAIERLRERLATELGEDEPLVTLHSGLTPPARYESFLRVLTGRARVVIGTRSAVFAPVVNLGLIAVWDDGHDAYASPRAPYIHTRVAATLRASQQGCAFLTCAYTRSAASQLLVESGWAHPLSAPRALVRGSTPLVEVVDPARREGEGAAGMGRLPAFVQARMRRALAVGPVLVQVPHAGYVRVLRCAECGEVARCSGCQGPLQASASGSWACRWCGRAAATSACAACGGRNWRAAQIGSERTAEELGRAFPGIAVVASGAARGVVDAVDDTPRLVVATPGAEPVAAGGYAAACILDAHVLLARPELWAPEEALRRWFAVGALVRPRGALLLVGDVTPRLAQALVRWDPVTIGADTLAERRLLAYPPAAHLIVLTGADADVTDVLARLNQIAPVLGPLPDGDGVTVRAIVRCPPGARDAVLERLREVLSARSVSRLRRVRVQVDPATV